MKLTKEQINTISNALHEAFEFIEGLTHMTDEEHDKWNEELQAEMQEALDILEEG